jgi:hypothetical protein
MARPIPEAAPVTKAFFSRMIFIRQSGRGAQIGTKAKLNTFAEGTP